LGNAWIPAGLYFDLWDINSTYYDGNFVAENKHQNNIMDEVWDIKWSDMYKNLQWSYDFPSFKVLLQQQNPAKKQTIEVLFKCYGY
jgi:hypothetical protein